MLRPDLFDIVDFLHDRGVGVNLISNGALIDDRAIARLTPDKISIFEIPLLGDAAAIHDRLSGRAGAFDGATLAIASLKAARQRVVTVFVATKINLASWPRALELAFALGADGVMFNRFNPGGRGLAHREELEASPQELMPALAFAQEFSERHQYPISCSIPMPPCLFDMAKFPRLSTGFCAAGTDRAYYTIDPAGNLRPCNHSPLILGNLRKKNFWNLVDRPAHKAFVKECSSACRGCAVEATCRGGCKAAPDFERRPIG
jgi:radical SAM protein with 4Fe4S-binding SPASM domain